LGKDQNGQERNDIPEVYQKLQQIQNNKDKLMKKHSIFLGGIARE